MFAILRKRDRKMGKNGIILGLVMSGVFLLNGTLYPSGPFPNTEGGVDVSNEVTCDELRELIEWAKGGIQLSTLAADPVELAEFKDSLRIYQTEYNEKCK